MFNFFDSIFNTLDSHEHHPIIVAVFISLALALACLRVFSHLHFRLYLISLRVDAKKPIKDRGDVARIRTAFTRNLVAEYIKTAENGVSGVSTHRLCSLVVDKMHFFGWKYTGMLPFVGTLQSALLWIGLILAVVFGHMAHVYGTLAIVIFLILHTCTAFFDAVRLRDLLIDESTLYIERSIAKFFASDAGGAVLRLKTDLVQAIDRLAAANKASQENLGSLLEVALAQAAESTQAATADIAAKIAQAIDDKLVNMNESLMEAVGAWHRAMTDAKAVQESMSGSADALQRAAAHLGQGADTMSGHMKRHTDALSEQSVALLDALEHTKTALAYVADEQSRIADKSAAFEQNQRALEVSLAAYESTLAVLSAKLGDGLGTYIALGSQKSVQDIGDAFEMGISNLQSVMAGEK